MAIPLKDSDLVAWGGNARIKLTATPEVYGYSVEQAALFHSRFQSYFDAYTTMTQAREEGNRSAAMTELTRINKAAFLELARPLYAAVQWSNTIPDADKIVLGVHVRATEPTPVPAPDVQPGTDLVSVLGRTVTLNVHDSTSSSKRGKPAGAVGAYVYSFVGVDYPTDPAAWQFEGTATRHTFAVTFPDSVAPGSKVWFCAAWINRKGESGPLSYPITTLLQGGLSSAA